MAGRLTALRWKNLTEGGRYGDGDGLWLQVRDADHRSWLFRYTVGRKARQMGLGPLPDVSLAEARRGRRRPGTSFQTAAIPSSSAGNSAVSGRRKPGARRSEPPAKNTLPHTSPHGEAPCTGRNGAIP